MGAIHPYTESWIDEHVTPFEKIPKTSQHKIVSFYNEHSSKTLWRSSWDSGGCTIETSFKNSRIFWITQKSPEKESSTVLVHHCAQGYTYRRVITFLTTTRRLATARTPASATRSTRAVTDLQTSRSTKAILHTLGLEHADQRSIALLWVNIDNKYCLLSLKWKILEYSSSRVFGRHLNVLFVCFYVSILIYLLICYSDCFCKEAILQSIVRQLHPRNILFGR